MELNIEQILQSERAWEFVLLDIVKSEELDPWDIDLISLTKNYLERIKKMKQLDLRIPARLILAAAILLKMQSDQLMQEEEEQIIEDLVFDMEGAPDLPEEEAEEVPLLDLRIRRKPIRKITLEDLLTKLQVSMEPKPRREKAPPFIIEFPETDITDQIEALYKQIMKKKMKKLPFLDLVQEKTKDDIIDTLLPLLHLANDHRIGLEQEEFFQDIFVLPKSS